MAALFGGKMPHTAALVPGGVTCGVDAAAVEDFRARLRRVRRFVENVYLPDVVTAAGLFPEYSGIGRGVARYLSYGVFEEGSSNWLPAGVFEDGTYTPLDTSKIFEEIGASRCSSGSKLHPTRGETRPEPKKPGAYSWLKAPRYGGAACEVGPLARMVVASAAGHQVVRSTIDVFLRDTGLDAHVLPSVLGRHVARLLEAVLLG